VSVYVCVCVCVCAVKVAVLGGAVVGAEAVVAAMVLVSRSVEALCV